MIVEGLGDPAGLVGALQEDHVHAHVLAGRNHRLALAAAAPRTRSGPGARGTRLRAPRRSRRSPKIFAASGLMRSGRARTFHSRSDVLREAVVGEDHADLGDVVELRRRGRRTRSRGRRRRTLARLLRDGEAGGKRGGAPNGSRTRVSALRGPRPRPLDDGSRGRGSVAGATSPSIAPTDGARSDASAPQQWARANRGAAPGPGGDAIRRPNARIRHLDHVPPPWAARPARARVPLEQSQAPASVTPGSCRLQRNPGEAWHDGCFSPDRTPIRASHRPSVARCTTRARSEEKEPRCASFIRVRAASRSSS